MTTDLLDAGLVDELHLWVHPLLVGPSDPTDLISHTRHAGRFELLDVVRFTSGLVILTYDWPSPSQTPNPATEPAVSG